MDPRYNAVIGRRQLYRIITRTALYWIEQQRTLVYLSCHICWWNTACCRCYRLRYQISAKARILHWTAAPFSVIKCKGSARLRCLRLCSFHRILRVLLGCYDLLRSHYWWIECTSTESTNLFSGPCYWTHIHVRPVYTYPVLVSPWKITIHNLNRVITESALYWSALLSHGSMSK